MTSLLNHGILSQCLQLLASEQSLRIIFHTLEGSHALCLLANLVQLFAVQNETNHDSNYPTFSVNSHNFSLLIKYMLFFIIHIQF